MYLYNNNALQFAENVVTEGNSWILKLTVTLETDAKKVTDTEIDQ